MNYDPNSNNLIKKNKTDENDIGKKKVNKVVNGNVKTKKKTKADEFADDFIAQSMTSVVSDIFTEVLLPSFKNMISDAVKSGIDRLLYGDSSYRKNSNNTPASKISYNKYYTEQSAYKPDVPVRIRETYDYNNIVFNSRGDAEAVLMSMDELISKYEVVRVADLYDLAGITGNYTDYKYGWTDIRSARIERIRDGYIIRMPKALPLD